MQSKTILIALIALVCIGAVGWLLWDSSQSANLVEWDQQDEVTVSAEDLAEQLQAGELGEGARDEVAGTNDGEGSDGELRPLVMIRGRVVTKDAVPVASAKVALSAQGRGRRSRISLEVVTKSDGTFAFSGKGFARMWVTLEVSHQDYAPATAFKPFDNAEGELDMGDIEVVTGGTIIGSITDMQGNLVVDAEARLRASDRRGFRGFGRGRRSAGLAAVKADSNGVFRMEHVPPGRFEVTASAPHRQRASKGPITVVDAQQERLDPIQLGPGFQLSGTVYRPDGEVLEGAQVNIRGGRFRDDKKTGKQGKFAFDHMPPGDYSITVEAKGYLTNEEYTGLEVTQTGPLAITMKPGLRIHGLVTDAVNGMPVLKYGARARRLRSLPNPEADARRAQTEQVMQRFRQLRAIGDQATKQQRAEIDTLLTKMHEPGGVGDRGGRGSGRGGARGGRGGDRGRRGGGRSGDRGGFGRGGRGRGSFTFGRSNGKLPGDTGDIEPHAEGKFSFDGLEEGVYVIDIGSPEHQKIRSVEIELREGVELAPLALLVQRGLRVSGKVQSKSHQGPLRNAEVELRLVTEDTTNSPSRNQDGNRSRRRGFSMFGTDANGLRTSRIMTAKSDSEGAFAFRNAPPGRYIVRAEAADHTTVSTSPFQLKADQPGITIALGALAVIEGHVSGIPPGKTTEARVMAFSRPRTMRDAKIEPNGSYKITGLEPGDYIVRAFLGDSRRFIFREMFRGMGQQTSPEPQVDIKVKEGGRHRLNVALTQTLTGTVVGQVMVNGRGAQGYRVTLRQVDDGEEQASSMRSRFGRGNSATVDQHGNYEVTGVEIGEYNVTITASSSGRSRRGGTAISRQRVFVAAEQTTRAGMVTIDFGSVVGTVTIPAATPTATGTTTPATNPKASAGRRRSVSRVSLYKGVTEVPDPGADGGADVLRFSARVRNSKFEIKELPTGSYLVQLRVSGRESVNTTIYVSSGTATSADLVAGKLRPRKPASPTQASGRR